MTLTATPPTHLRAAARRLGADAAAAVGLARRPWSHPCRVGRDDVPLRVRGAVVADLARVAVFHSRCSGDTLLQRYLMGGRAPSLATLTAMLAEPLVLVAQAPGGEVVAMASALSSTMRAGSAPVGARALAFGLVVQDPWQRRGLGRALAAHLAGAAHLMGARELVTDIAATTLPLRRVLDDVGLTRSSRTHLGQRLHTRLDVGSLAGLGPLRDVLAG